MSRNLYYYKFILRKVSFDSALFRKELNKAYESLSYEETLILLEFLPYAACRTIWQVVRSAAANAYVKTGISKKDLLIKEIYVNQGPVLKRFRTRSQGRAFAIRKPTCHITVILSDGASHNSFI